MFCTSSARLPPNSFLNRPFFESLFWFEHFSLFFCHHRLKSISFSAWGWRRSDKIDSAPALFDSIRSDRVVLCFFVIISWSSHNLVNAVFPCLSFMSISISFSVFIVSLHLVAGVTLPGDTNCNRYISSSCARSLERLGQFALREYLERRGSSGGCAGCGIGAAVTSARASPAFLEGNHRTHPAESRRRVSASNLSLASALHFLSWISPRICSELAKSDFNQHRIDHHHHASSSFEFIQQLLWLVIESSGINGPLKLDFGEHS